MRMKCRCGTVSWVELWAWRFGALEFHVHRFHAKVTDTDNHVCLSVNMHRQYLHVHTKSVEVSTSSTKKPRAGEWDPLILTKNINNDQTTMVKVSSSRAPLRKRQGSKPSTILFGTLVSIVVGFLYLTYYSTTAGDAAATNPAAQQAALLATPQQQATSGLKTTTTSTKKTGATATTTIGYVVSVTGCGSDPLAEGAAVLKHAIHQSSIQGNHPNARYDYHMYAIVHPDALDCGMTLQELGYTVLKRDTPVAVKDIKGEFLRTHIEKNG